MVLYRTLADLPPKIRTRLGEFMAPDEEFVLAVTQTKRLLTKWVPHYILTTGQLIRLRKIWFVEDIAETPLQHISQVSWRAKSLKGAGKLTVHTHGVSKEYPLDVSEGDEFADAIRAQLAEQKQAP